MRCLLLLLIFTSTALGQIDIGREHKPHYPIAAKLTTPIPEDADLQGGWEVSDKARFLECGRAVAHIWAPPGEHRISFRGAWVKTRLVTVDGEQLPVLEGFGWVSESAAFTVLGGDDDEDDSPDPPPPPPDDGWGIIVHESSRISPHKAALFQRVRDRLHEKSRARPGLYIIDQHNRSEFTAPYLDIAQRSGLSLPVLIIVSRQPGVSPEIIKCPQSADEILRAVGLE